MAKKLDEYGNVYIGLHVPPEFEDRIQKFLENYNKEFKAKTGRKMYKAELFILAVNQYIEDYEKKEDKKE